ncbi:small VCP/p97-interacting protein isoform X2 [Anopheles moucheti]|uniref:small VCP/p97-interacting protein isoform X2 n=1 Tax=Anopheles moucheti TaxID=186751 RepID=UPI0022F081CF|nr:small VCP/p97-interacting protein isoform X2 [Anopheles moucheti]
MNSEQLITGIADVPLASCIRNWSNQPNNVAASESNKIAHLVLFTFSTKAAKAYKCFVDSSKLFVMGLCSSCFKGSTEELLTPDVEVRRQQQREAAERRRIEQESRGIKDPEKVRRQQQRAMEQERREQEASRMGGQQPTLKWQQD